MFQKKIIGVFVFLFIATPFLTGQDFSFSQAVLDEAVDRELTTFVFNINYRTEMGGTDWYGAPDGRCREIPYALGGTVCTRLQGGIYTTKAIAYLAMAAHFAPNAVASNGASITDRLLVHLRHLISGGEESSTRGGGIVGHHEGTLVTALAFAKLTPAVWNQLTATEQNKIEWQMRFMMAAANFSQNYDSPNGQARGVMGPKSFLKRHNPNLVVGNVETMTAAYYFFGSAQTVNNLLADFDYDTYLATAASLGFTNITQTWNIGLQRWGKNKLNNDIRRPFTYEHQYPATEPDGTSPAYPKGIEIPFDPFEIMFSLNLRNFYHTVADQSPLGYGYQLGGVSTPVAGQQGMAYEFAAADSGPERSDLKYVHESLNTSVFNMALVASQGDFSSGDLSKVNLLKQRMLTGFTDFFFKAEHGWYSYQTGGSPGEGPLDGRDLVDRGFNYTHDVFYQYVLQFLDEAPPPPPTTTVTVRARLVGTNCCIELGVQGMANTDYGSSNSMLVQAFQTIDQTSFQEYVYTLVGEFPANQIRVHFANDATSRDVAVDYIELNGVQYQSEAPNTYSVGVWNGSCNGGFKEKPILACNGYFHYNTNREAPPAIPEIGDMITLRANNGNYLGHNGSTSSSVLANSSSVGTSERWYIVEDGDGDPSTVGLRASNNQLLSAEKRLGSSMRLRPNFNGNNRERFYMEAGDSGQIYLRSKRHNTYVSLKSATRLIADMEFPGPTETFNFQIESNIALVMDEETSSETWYDQRDITSISEKYSEANKVQFFPNPIQSDLLLLSTSAQVSITDLMGRTLLRIEHKVQQVDLSTFLAGTYIIQIDNQTPELLIRQ